jgi:hypothetical protein
MKIKHFILVGLLLGAAFACTSNPEATSESKMEKLPFFDIKGYLDQEIPKMDGANIAKISRVQGQQEKSDVVYSVQDWKDELDIFYQADINRPSLALSYDTKIQDNYLVHTLFPEAKGKVKEITVRYHLDKPTRITVKLIDENIFYTSIIIGKLYYNVNTFKIDHYSVESTQKIWFLKANNMKITGTVK